jgi:uncharacterized membrane protein
MLHLLHPAFVHFSVALLFLGGLWEAWGQATGGKTSIRRGGIMTIAGTVSLLPTLASGYLAANSIPVPDSASTVFGLHELNGWVVAGLFVGLLFWKGWYRGVVPAKQRRYYTAALLLGVLLVGYGAFLGGDMVYMHGVGVRSGVPAFP